MENRATYFWKRRSRVDAASETWYNWDMGWTVVSEEDDANGDSVLDSCGVAIGSKAGIDDGVIYTDRDGNGVFDDQQTVPKEEYPRQEAQRAQ